MFNLKQEIVTGEWGSPVLNLGSDNLNTGKRLGEEIRIPFCPRNQRLIACLSRMPVAKASQEEFRASFPPP
ncbi:MAG: hypothetical protein PHC88_02415 [Terrimicrobiaceae bacterium]|nr:hypothetical protein [Terrimicrobiaceae bacterium]